MKPLALHLCLVGTLFGLSVLAFSQLGTPPQTQPLAAAPDGTVATPLAEGYFVANGASYFTRNGQAFRVERAVSIRVTPTGIIGFDGQPLPLAQGMMLTTDGRHAPIPPAINIRTLPGGANPFPATPAEARRVAPPEPADAPALQQPRL